MDLTNIEGIEPLECITVLTQVASYSVVVWQFTFTGILCSTLRRHKKLFILIAYAKVTRIVSLVCMHAIEIGRVFLPLIANMLFVSINFSLEKDFVIFPVFVNDV